MSFLRPKIIPRGFIATTSNRTTPRKRLSSVSEISLKPALPTLPRPYVKRANIDPFEQHYVTPFLRMFDEEEAENAKNRLITDEQKSTLKILAEAAASSELGRRIVYGARRTSEQPVESLYDLVTLPADIAHALETKINTGNETGRLLQTEENAIEQNEKDKEIRQTVDDISTFVRRTGGLPTWGIRKLKQLKKKYFDDDDVDVSSNIQAWNKEEERLQQETATQQLQGLLTSKYQQKGYKERMEATKSLQSLLKAQEVQKEQEKQQEAAEALQGLLRGDKIQQEFEDTNASTQQLQGLLVSKKQQDEYKAKQKALEEMQGIFRQPLEEAKHLEEVIKKSRRPRPNPLKRPTSYDDDLFEHPPALKKSRFDTSDVFETRPRFNLDLDQIRQDVRKFFTVYQKNPDPKRIPDEMHATLEIYLNNKKTRAPTIMYEDPLLSINDGYYQYNPKTKELVVMPAIRDTALWNPPKGFKWV